LSISTREYKITGGTLMKAFFGAPAWSKDELYKFWVAMERVGMIPEEQKRNTE